MVGAMKRVWVATFVAFVVVALPQAKAGEIVAEFNGLKVGIDEASGSLIRLEFPGVGVMLEAPPGRAGLLDVAYPLPEFVAMRLGSTYSAARIERGDGAIKIVYVPLGASRANVKLPEGAVGAEVVIRAADDGRSVVLRAKIVNDSKALIPQVLFPDLRGLKPC